MTATSWKKDGNRSGESEARGWQEETGGGGCWSCTLIGWQAATPSQAAACGPCQLAKGKHWSSDLFIPVEGPAPGRGQRDRRSAWVQSKVGGQTREPHRSWRVKWRMERAASGGRATLTHGMFRNWKKSFAKGGFCEVGESITECQGCRLRSRQTPNKISLFSLPPPPPLL